MQKKLVPVAPSMASPLSYTISSLFTPKLSHTNFIKPTKTLQFTKNKNNLSFQSIKFQSSNSNSATTTTTTTTVEQEDRTTDEESIGIDNLHRFIQLNLGTWVGSFHQFDANGKLLHKVSTKLSASSYGEDQLISLIQTLYIKQPLSATSYTGYEEEVEWAEYKIKESNMFTVDKYQQLGFFPNEKAFALRYQTAGMLENVLRQGVLGEDDTGEESPRNLKLPPSRPSIVCENCLYSIENNMRARAFHIMDPKGVPDMLLLFLEVSGSNIDSPPSLSDSENGTDRVLPFLGHWKGKSVTKRSGVYGATIAEHDTTASLEIAENGQLIQDITTKAGDVTTNVRWTGTLSDNLVTFDKGYQVTLLPGGMYMGCPCDITNSIADSKSFHLEFCWLESSVKRQRLIRTFDVEGFAVSSTYVFETRVEQNIK